MKNLSFLLLIFSNLLLGQGVAINLNNLPPDSSAILDLNDTTKGLLIPRLDSAQIFSILNPANGLMVFNVTSGCLNFYFNGTWVDLCSNSNQPLNFTKRIGFGTSSTWTCPVGVSQILVELWGGGGGGGGGSGAKDLPYGYGCTNVQNSNCIGGSGGNGGKGGYSKTLISVTPGANYFIYIGAGGQGGIGGVGAINQNSSTGGNGAKGDSTWFSNIIYAVGGQGGGGGLSQNLGQYLATCSNGSVGQDGLVQNYNPTPVLSQSNSSQRTYIPIGYVSQSIIANCCSSGGAGGIGVTNSNGTNGGAGENGYCVIWY